MKTLISIFLFLGIVVGLVAQSQVTVVSDLNVLRLPRYQQIQVNTVTNITPVRLSQTNLWCRRVTLLGKKQWRTNNTGTVWIGVNSTNDTQPFQILTGGEAKIENQTGTKLNLYDWYLDTDTSGDGIVLILDHH